jgi:hypothetical protein
MKYGIVYLWYDRYKKKFYVGSHWGTENDGYICSSTYMKRAYNKRPQDFKRKIISKIYNKNNLLEEEYKWLSMIKTEELGKKYYNFTNHHPGHWAFYEKYNIIKKYISEETKKAMWRPEVREKYLEGIKNRDTRSSDLEVRKKRSKSMMGKNIGKDNSKAVRISAEMRKDQKLSEIHKQKIKDTTIFKELNNKKIQCKYCNFIGNVGNLGRYHNEKCKHKVR